MNLLVHLWLAERSHSSAAGQILGDVIKGRLDSRLNGRLPPAIRDGIRLHRAIDGFSDAHPAHRAMRRHFEAPLRRYAGILVDIGFDHSLANTWPDYSHESLAGFAAAAERQVRREWPAQAPFAVARMRGLATVLHGYAQPAGVQRALDSVARRLTHRNPLGCALPALLAQKAAFDAALPGLLAALEAHVVTLYWSAYAAAAQIFFTVAYGAI
jgi:acyl carrier protein phosphodiesterase